MQRCEREAWDGGDGEPMVCPPRHHGVNSSTPVFLRRQPKDPQSPDRGLYREDDDPSLRSG
jgi:hypothetical protein